MSSHELGLDIERISPDYKKSRLDYLIDSWISETLAKRPHGLRPVKSSRFSKRRILVVTCLITLGVTAFMISFPTSTGPLISRVFNDPHCSIQTPRASGSQSAANRKSHRIDRLTVETVAQLRV